MSTQMRGNILKAIILLSIELLQCESLAQFVYPLAAGNTWHYKITYLDYQPPRSSSSSTNQVIGDTIMPNGKHYWVFDHNDMLGGRYMRCDSGTIYYWQSLLPGSEKQVIDLNAPPGKTDTIDWNGFSQSVSGSSSHGALFGKTTAFHPFALGGLVFGHLTFAAGFGYSTYEYFADGSTTDFWELTGCLISDTLYGMTGVDHMSQELSGQFVLLPNYPNPFNPSTMIGFRVSGLGSSWVRLAVYDLLGREVAVLVDEKKASGNYEVKFDGNGLSSGVYFYRIEAGSFGQTRELLLIR